MPKGPSEATHEMPWVTSPAEDIPITLDSGKDALPQPSAQPPSLEEGIKVESQ